MPPQVFKNNKHGPERGAGCSIWAQTIKMMHRTSGSFSRPSLTPKIQKQVKNNFKYFAKGGAGDNMMPAKREKMFLGMLSIVHPDDTPLLVAMKDKKFQGLYKGVTKLAVQEAWPNLIKE